MDTNVYKTKLEAEKTDLEAVLASHGRKLNDSGDWIAVPPEHDGSNADPNEVADRVEDFEASIASLTVLEERYSEVIAALGRIEAGTYGVCEVSGEPIEPERLEANPAARTSMAHMNS